MICIGGRIRDDRCECAGASRQLAGRIHACGDRSIPVFIPALGGFGGSIQPPQGAGSPPPDVPAAAPPGGSVATAESFATDEVLVSADRATPENVDDAVAQSHGLQVLERINLDHLNGRLVRLRITDGRTPATVTAELQGDVRIYAPQANFYYRHQQADTSSSMALQYALLKLDVPRAESLAHGSGALVAVIDSGIDQTHPDLAGSIADVFRGSEADSAGDSHGTEISGIICAHGVVRGVASDARLLDVRVFQPRRSDRPSVATTFDLMRGIDWALAKHARILNMSFVGPRDPLLERSIGVAAAYGAIIVAAAGNGGPKAPFAYPAAYPGVIAVTATDVADRLYVSANHGRYIAIAAPGVDVLVSSGDHAHQLVSGTSYAAAYVSGIVALMIERNPSLRASAARLALTTAAVDLGPPGPDDQFGAGRVNAFASLQALTAP
jgi:subtilisin family serine protease